MVLNRPLGIRFSKEDEAELKKRATNKGIKLSSYVRVLVKEKLNENEISL